MKSTRLLFVIMQPYMFIPFAALPMKKLSYVIPNPNIESFWSDLQSPDDSQFLPQPDI